MQNFPAVLRLSATMITFAISGRAGIAAPASPQTTVTNEGTANDDAKRVVARYGIIEESEQPSKLAVKELSTLLRNYPDAKTWAVAYNVDAEQWRILEYNIELRELTTIGTFPTSKDRHWAYDYYPSHIHRAPQQGLDTAGLWKSKRSNQPR